ncbi:hypothetical protein NDU88_000568 [Pleurodeles waltl]|uniref:Uncharacterized protein n=1 Tax=Pleurodeles waltl TaxID=8319 RepID=A0AAV7P187_PLEWA|nr:hypothetical protein NDU88_000568 [Pleurodeles waltl]
MPTTSPVRCVLGLEGKSQRRRENNGCSCTCSPPRMSHATERAWTLLRMRTLVTRPCFCAVIASNKAWDERDLLAPGGVHDGAEQSTVNQGMKQVNGSQSLSGGSRASAGVHDGAERGSGCRCQELESCRIMKV